MTNELRKSDFKLGSIHGRLGLKLEESKCWLREECDNR